MNSVQFIDAVRARHGLTSDNKVAAFLGIPRPRISLYRTGTRKLDPDACLKVAKALDLPAEHVFASVQAERAKRTEHRRVWERLAKIAKHGGAAAVVGLAVFASPQTNMRAAEPGCAKSVYSVKSRTWSPRSTDRRRRRDRRRASRPAVSAA